MVVAGSILDPSPPVEPGVGFDIIQTCLYHREHTAGETDLYTREVASMRFAVLGTGMVGRSIAARLASLGHDVTIGTRDIDALLARTEPDAMGTEPFSSWREQHAGIGLATFADAAAAAEVLVNATNGAGSVEALTAAGEEHLDGKVLIDISNPLDFSQGMPPSLFVSNTDSLGEQIQRAFPGARVVKTLNTMNALIMADPSLVAGGDHTVFLSGNDDGAKAQVSEILGSFGWRDILDLGDITTARGPEMYLPLWLRLFGALGTRMYNIKVVRAEG
jgi:predicted dinucleotide-binding enzyme